MYLLENWKFLYTCLIFINECLLVHTVLEKAFKTVHFDSVVVSHKLFECFVLVSQGAHASHLTIFPVMESSAFVWFFLFFLLVLF